MAFVVFLELALKNVYFAAMCLYILDKYSPW